MDPEKRPRLHSGSGSLPSTTGLTQTAATGRGSVIVQSPPQAGSIPGSGELSLTPNLVETWLDENQSFVQDYVSRKGTRKMIDAWLLAHTVSHAATSSSSASNPNSGATTPVRKISAHEFEKGSCPLPPMINTAADGSPTFLSQASPGSSTVPIVSPSDPDATGTPTVAVPKLVRRKTRAELQSLDEKNLIFELVKDICNDLDVKSLCYKILQNITLLLRADRSSLVSNPTDHDQHSTFNDDII